MHRSLTALLACPECRGELALAAEGVVEAADGHVESGTLVCAPGEHRFAVVRGVPRLAPGVQTPDVAGTVAGFGYEWTHEGAKHVRERDEEQFLDWVVPLALDDFRGRSVLEAGCGMGRWVRCVAQAGAADVVGADLSESVESAFANTRHLPNAHIVQGDIFRLPFRRAFDVAYSIGVLHHTPDPERAFRCVQSFVRPGGRMFAWVYGREGNGWIVHLVDPVRTHVTSRLPRGLLWHLSTLLTIPLHGFCRLAFARNDDGTTTRRFPAPYGAYLGWLARYDFAHTRAIVFDHLVPGLAFYIRGEEFRGWFERCGHAPIAITARNGNSWRGLGTIPTAT